MFYEIIFFLYYNFRLISVNVRNIFLIEFIMEYKVKPTRIICRTDDDEIFSPS
jgi:hypothetical protein